MNVETHRYTIKAIEIAATRQAKQRYKLDKSQALNVRYTQALAHFQSKRAQFIEAVENERQQNTRPMHVPSKAATAVLANN